MEARGIVTAVERERKRNGGRRRGRCMIVRKELGHASSMVTYLMSCIYFSVASIRDIGEREVIFKNKVCRLVG